MLSRVHGGPPKMDPPWHDLHGRCSTCAIFVANLTTRWFKCTLVVNTVQAHPIASFWIPTGKRGNLTSQRVKQCDVWRRLCAVIALFAQRTMSMKIDACPIIHASNSADFFRCARF
ncbi:hypothetical protein H257_11661 [Aphanomyces astaci]|uniref:Uncharacterized protein n=1 Tax=Aphanomyces astaci TaxID=112090 RepID=W4G1G1_APHAT|nr:hypothetical protein H257_11661 [Aphanomyces astaci]ETV73535.1 hypothetical protein H257_11661 [Aphanomyces astaci]|eukprot:XP_009836961.1 hypothetical protein H257_11661 [Aphanomyces astaci]